jgi:dihydropteroate synthase
MIATLRVRGSLRQISGTLVMGVVNASPESFSDAGQYATVDDRIALAAELVAAGADVIDIGGQSAITNQPEVQAALEIERVVPIVEWLHRMHPDVLISVDTYKAPVVDAVLAAGADIINDVSGLLYPEVAAKAGAAGAALVIMHNRARPKVRLQDPGLYDDVLADVVSFLATRMESAVQAGMPREGIVLDPGPDFTKTPHQTLAVLRGLDALRALGRPLLLALSRKDFLGAILNRPPRGRDAGSLAALALLGAAGGNLARVHDVAASVDVVRTVEYLMGRQELSEGYLLPEELRHERGAASSPATT